MSGMEWWAHENQIKWANMTQVLGFASVDRWMFLDSSPEIWKCYHNVVSWKEYVLWRKADLIWNLFSLWLCGLSILYNLLDSQFPHLQNGRNNIYFKGMWELNEVAKQRKCLPWSSCSIKVSCLFFLSCE